MVPEPEDEGQTAEALLTVASPSRRPPGSAPDGPCVAVLCLALPLPPATPPPSSAPPPLPPGPLLAGVLASRPLRHPPEVPGGDPTLPVPQQAQRAASVHSGRLPLGRPRAPPHLVSLPSLFALGARTVAQSQRGSAGSAPTTQSQTRLPAVCQPGAEGRDGVTLSKQAAAERTRNKAGEPTV